MILAFSGEPFLARRAARAALREAGLEPSAVVAFGEGMDPQAIGRAASQGGLFGQVGLFLDFDEAFHGQAGVRPRNEVVDALAGLDPSVLVVVLDSGATPARQKRYRALGRSTHLPIPRFERLPRWVRGELEAAGVRFGPDVPDTLADLFGEDPAAIVSEIGKLASLEEVVDGDRVRALANRPSARSAFDLIERVVAGDAAASLTIARDLMRSGEAPQRVFGALTWQFGLVAKAVALRQAEGDVDAREAASRLGAAPAAARRALAVAARFDEPALRRALHELLDAEQRAKSGGDPEWALEAAVVSLARFFAPAPARAQRPSSGPGDHAR